MTPKHRRASIRGPLVFMAVLLHVIIIRTAFTSDASWYYLLIVSVPVCTFIVKNYSE